MQKISNSGKTGNSFNKPIINIYKEKELKEGLTMQKISNVDKTDNSFNKPTNYYNLDMIFAV
jgi:hypothetical protein